MRTTSSPRLSRHEKNLIRNSPTFFTEKPSCLFLRIHVDGCFFRSHYHRTLEGQERRYRPQQDYRPWDLCCLCRNSGGTDFLHYPILRGLQGQSLKYL